MIDNLLLAFALMLVLEGVFPFTAPAAWREVFQRLIQLSDGQIRFLGLTTMVAGVILVTIFK